MNYYFFVTLYFIAFCHHWRDVHSRDTSYIEWCEDAGERRRVEVGKCHTFPFVYPYPICYCLSGIASLTSVRDGDVLYELQFSKQGCFSHKSIGSHNRTIELLPFEFEDTETIVGVLGDDKKWNLQRVPQLNPINTNGTISIFNGQLIDTDEDYEEGNLFCIQKNIDPDLTKLIRHYKLPPNSWLQLNNTCDGGNYVEDLDLISSTDISTPENQGCVPICPEYIKKPKEAIARPPDGTQPLRASDADDTTDFNQRKDCIQIPQDLKAKHKDLNDRILKFSIERAFHDQQHFKKVYEPVRSFRVLDLLAKITTKYCRHAKIPANFLEQAIVYFKIAHEGQTGFEFSEFFSNENLFVIQRMLRRCLWSLEPPYYTSTGCDRPEILTTYSNESNPAGAKFIQPTVNHQYFDHHVVLDIPWNMLDLANTVCVKGFSESYRMYHEMEQGIERLFTPQLRRFWLYPDVASYYYEHIFGPHWMTLAKNLEKCVETAYMNQPQMARLHRPAWISGLRQSTRHKGTLVDPICTRRRTDIPLVSDNYEIYCENPQDNYSIPDDETTSNRLEESTNRPGSSTQRAEDVKVDWPETKPPVHLVADTFIDWPGNNGSGKPHDQNSNNTYIDWPNRKGNSEKPTNRPDETYLDWPTQKGTSERPTSRPDDTYIDWPNRKGNPEKSTNRPNETYLDWPNLKPSNRPDAEHVERTQRQIEDHSERFLNQPDGIYIDWPNGKPLNNPDDTFLDWPNHGGTSQNPTNRSDDTLIDWPNSEQKLGNSTNLPDDILIDWPNSEQKLGNSTNLPDDILIDWPNSEQNLKNSTNRPDDILIDWPNSEQKLGNSTNLPDDTLIDWPNSEQNLENSTNRPDDTLIDWPNSEQNLENSTNRPDDTLIDWPNSEQNLENSTNRPDDTLIDWPNSEQNLENSTNRPDDTLIDWPNSEQNLENSINRPDDTLIDWPNNEQNLENSTNRLEDTYIDWPNRKSSNRSDEDMIIDWPQRQLGGYSERPSNRSNGTYIDWPNIQVHFERPRESPSNSIYINWLNGTNPNKSDDTYLDWRNREVDSGRPSSQPHDTYLDGLNSRENPGPNKPSGTIIDWPKNRESLHPPSNQSNVGIIDWPENQSKWPTSRPDGPFNPHGFETSTSHESDETILDWPKRGENSERPPYRPDDTILDWPKNKGNDVDSGQNNHEVTKDRVRLDWPPDGTSEERSTGSSVKDILDWPEGIGRKHPDGYLYVDWPNKTKKLKARQPATSAELPSSSHGDWRNKLRGRSSGQRGRSANSGSRNFEQEDEVSESISSTPEIVEPKVTNRKTETLHKIVLPSIPASAIILETSRQSQLRCPPTNQFESMEGVDCSKFYTCIPGGGEKNGKLVMTLKCKPGTIFNTQLQDCVDGICPSSHVTITSTLSLNHEPLSSPPVLLSTGTAIAHKIYCEKSQSNRMSPSPNDCTMFYMCLNIYGQWFVNTFKCPQNSYFEESVGCVRGSCPDVNSDLQSTNFI